MDRATYVSKYNATLLVDVWLVVVINLEFREQDLVLVC